MARILYALRFMAWLSTWKVGGPNRPFRFYLEHYDRRQEIFRDGKKGKESCSRK